MSGDEGRGHIPQRRSQTPFGFFLVSFSCLFVILFACTCSLDAVHAVQVTELNAQSSSSSSAHGAASSSAAGAAAAAGSSAATAASRSAASSAQHAGSSSSTTTVTDPPKFFSADSAPQVWPPALDILRQHTWSEAELRAYASHVQKLSKEERRKFRNQQRRASIYASLYDSDLPENDPRRATPRLARLGVVFCWTGVFSPQMRG